MKIDEISIRRRNSSSGCLIFKIYSHHNVHYFDFILIKSIWKHLRLILGDSRVSYPYEGTPRSVYTPPFSAFIYVRMCILFIDY